MQGYLLEEKSKFLAYFKYKKQDLKIMKGVILGYFEEKNSGYISGDDNIRG